MKSVFATEIVGSVVRFPIALWKRGGVPTFGTLEGVPGDAKEGRVTVRGALEGVG
jgi:hypothetical protein